MHPITGKGLAAMGTDTLCNFIFMVRKNQVLSAAVDIDGYSKMLFCHH